MEDCSSEGPLSYDFARVSANAAAEETAERAAGTLEEEGCKVSVWVPIVFY